MNESDSDRRWLYFGHGFIWALVAMTAVALATNNAWFTAAAGVSVVGLTAVEYHYKERETA